VTRNFHRRQPSCNNSRRGFVGLAVLHGCDFRAVRTRACCDSLTGLGAHSEVSSVDFERVAKCCCVALLRRTCSSNKTMRVDEPSAALDKLSGLATVLVLAFDFWNCARERVVP